MDEEAWAASAVRAQSSYCGTCHRAIGHLRRTLEASSDHTSCMQHNIQANYVVPVSKQHSSPTPGGN